MTRHVPTSGKATKQGRRKSAKSGAASTRARKRSLKATELQKQLAEALQQQAASAEVLKIIGSSPGDMKPVFEAILVNALRICDAKFGHILLYDGERFDGVHLHEVPPSYRSFWEKHGPITPSPNTALGRLVRTKQVEHIPDLKADPAYAERQPLRVVTVEQAGARSFLAVPMIKQDTLVGAIIIYRQKVQPFAERQIELVKTFADQAVIAIENTRLFTETQEALARQGATAEVLKIVASSPNDVKPVFSAIVLTVLRVLRCDRAFIMRCEGGFYFPVARAALDGSFVELTSGSQPIDPAANFPSRAIVTKKTLYYPDRSVIELPEYERFINEKFGVNSSLFLPLLRQEECIGVLALASKGTNAFTASDIALAEAFCDQALIAIENARLFNETNEALAQQRATAEVLQVINSSPGNLAPVFEAILEKAHGLCAVAYGSLQLYDGNEFRAVAVHGLSEAFAERLRQGYVPGPKHQSRQLIEGERFVQAPDLAEIDDPIARAAFAHGGIRTALFIPLRKEGSLIGQIVAARREVRLFSQKEIALLENFAAQAVVAMESARLFGELRDRTADLTRSVDELTATADVLKVISRSSVDLKTVLDTLCETVARLCRADQTPLYRRRDDKHHLVAAWGMAEEAMQFALAHPLTPGRGTLTGRVILERRAVHIPDVLQDLEYTDSERQKAMGYRTLLGIPLLREDALLGVFAISRTRLEPFTDKEIKLATSFADQAVIAIENARLFEELRERQAELRVTFDNMGDGVVMFGADTRLIAWNRNFQEILDLPDAFLAQRPSYADYFRYLAERGEYSADLEAELSRTLDDTKRESRFERTRPDGRVIEVRRNPIPGGGFVLIYADITERKRAEEAIRAARDAAEKALRELQTAQASLVHAQKMAALGQVTAGIAHEIKNPLNFVNNFAGLSVELLDELKEAAGAVGALDPGKRAEIVETIRMLTGNLEKIVEHGRRADGIVRSMLQHSRGSSDDRQPTNLNALAEEALNLAYHGARAQDPNFDIALEHDLDSNLASVDVVPQELTRVLLNLIGNGFYAANERCRESDGTYRPALRVTTREFGESVEVRVRDNGIGVPPENRDKLFQPFFTTKPTGEGTGLGLSISYEIVTQQHGGTITVESEVGDFTEFTVRLPRL